MDATTIRWDSQSCDSSQSMPVGGGDVGCNVWVEQGRVSLYLAQSGWFDENNSLLKAGRLRLTLEPDPFGEGFSQTLHADEGRIVLTGSDWTVDIWVDRLRAVVHAELQGQTPRTLSVAYETWRTEDRTVENTSYELFQCTEMFFYPLADPTFHADTVTLRDHGLLVRHRNDNGDLSMEKEFLDQGLGQFYEGAYNPQKDRVSGSRLWIDGGVHTGIDEGVCQGTPFKAYHFAAESACRHHVAMALLTCQTPEDGPWQAALENHLLESVRQCDAIREENARWWQNFTARSQITIDPDHPGSDWWKLGRNYTLFRCMLGANEGSMWPTKFNGGLFTFDPLLAEKTEWTDEPLAYTPDYRLWGGGSHTIQNQRLLYWPMLRSGDAETMVQHFDFFLRTLDTSRNRVRHHFGIEGAAYAEQVGTYGLCCGCNQEWGNRSGLPCTQIRYHFSNSLETILLILEYHDYTGEAIDRYWPLIHSILQFYDGFYPQQDAKGHMVLYPANALETYHVVKNPVDAIAGLDCVLSRLLNLPELPENLREFCRRLRERVPPLSTRVKDGHTILAYAESRSIQHNCEIPELYPVFPYGQYGLLEENRGGMQLAVDTARYAPETEEQRSAVSWHPTGIVYARLGMVDEAVDFLFRKLSDGPHRFPAFWGPGHDWTPDHNWGGSGMMQLQEMLLQTRGSRILLLPCWPRDVDVSFRLWAPGRTVVTCDYRNGTIEKLEVFPPERQKDIEYPV